MQLHIEKSLRKTFKEETTARCMTMSKVITLFMKKFIEKPAEAIDFLFDN